MTRRARVWLIVSVVFALVNVAGAVFAAASGEVIHASTHVALAFVGAAVALRIWRPWHDVAIPATLGTPRELDDRLSRLEQSVEDMAVSVERVGEGQRFIEHVVAEGGIGPAPRERAAAPVESERSDGRSG
jgi:hypothetical protein